MDKLKLQEELKALNAQADQLENQLKLIGVEISDLPDDVNLLLDKNVQVQRQSHLHELTLNTLREFYFTKKKENIEHNLTTAQQSRELDKLKRALEDTEKDIEVLRTFNETINKTLISDANVERNIEDIEGTAKNLLDRQKNFKIPKDFNLESVMDKVDALEKRK